MNNETFLAFLNELEDSSNTALIESIDQAYSMLFEARVLPVVTEAKPEEKLKQHYFRIKQNEADKKMFNVATRDKNNKPIAMLVQFRRMKPETTNERGNNVWMINFVKDGQSDFNVTNEGSLDAFNSVFAIIQYFINTYHPSYITYKATDADSSKASQKSRIYDGYFRNLGLTKDESNGTSEYFKV